ncbi:TonB-dependent receptor [Xylophilus sp. GW821-FHT01B05]
MRIPFMLLPLAAAVAQLAPATAGAQATLGTVTVRDVADPAATVPSIEQARAAARRVPGGTDIVDVERVREGRVSTLQDVLALSPGVVAQPRFGSEETRLSIRGSALQRTFHLRGIKLMQDGIPITLTDGSGDFQALEPLAARYVRVERGANALQYGGSTLGGAINYVSPTGYDTPGLEVRGEAGSYGYRREHVQGGFVRGAGPDGGPAVGAVDGFASFSGYQQQGYRAHARQEAWRFNGNIGYRLSDDVETRLYLGLARSRSELPGNLTRAEYQANPRQAAAGNVALDQQRNIEVARIASLTTIALGQDRVELNAFWSHKHLFHPIFQVLDQGSDDLGVGARWVREGTLAGRRNRFVAGAQLGYGVLDDDRFVNLGGSPGARTNQLHQTAASAELYVQNDWYLRPDLALITGLQAARGTRRNADRFIAAGEGDESFSRGYSGFSPRLGVLWDVVPKAAGAVRGDFAQLFANLSRSFEPPSFGELTGGLRPNLLNAQRATTLEVGSRGARGALDWDLALYRAAVRDEMLQTQVLVAGNSSVAAPQTANVPRTVHQGIEAGVGWQPTRQWEWRSTWTLNDFRFDGDPSFGNNRLPGVPRQLLRSELLWRAAPGGVYAGPVLTVAGRTDADMANTTSAEGYALLGLKTGGPLGKNASWFVEARNLADRRHIASVNVVRSATAATALYLPGDGRSVYAGLQWKL